MVRQDKECDTDYFFSFDTLDLQQKVMYSIGQCTTVRTTDSLGADLYFAFVIDTLTNANIYGILHYIAMISEGKIINEAFKARNKMLFDWGLSFETAGGIELMQELLARVSIAPHDRQNTAQSLFIGIIRENSQAMLELSNDEIKALIEDGFSARQERRRKRVKAGIVTLNNFTSEFTNGVEIFEWLVSSKILSLAGRSKGYFKGLKEEERYLIESNFPDAYAKIIAILEVSRDTKITIKTKRFYEIQGTERRLNL